MKLETFFEKFDQFADAPDAVAKMRELILGLAVRGRLVPQDPSDEPATELVTRVALEKLHLLQKKEIKAESPTVPISGDEALFEIPSSWTWVRAGDLCRPISSGSTPDQSVFHSSEGIPYLKVYNIRSQFVDFEYKRQFIDVRHHEERMKRSRLLPGDVIMNIVGPPLGKVAIVPDEYPEWNCNQAIAFFRPIFPEFAPYLYTFLKQGSFLQNIQLIGTAGQDNISVTKCKFIPIPLPPLAEQKRIVAKVDELMALCDRLEAQQQEREEQASQLARASLARFADAPTPANLQLLFHSSLHIPPSPLRQSILTLAVQGKLVPQDPNDEPAEDLIARLARELTQEQRRKQAAPLTPLPAESLQYDVPESWTWARFRDVAIIASNLVKPDEFLDFTHLAPDNIEKGNGVLLPCRTVREDKVISSNHRFYPGQIVYSKIRPNLAKVVVVDFEGLCSADMYPIDALIDPFYLQRYMLSESFLVQAVKTDTRVAMPKINQMELNAIAVPVPPLAEQRRIVAKVEQLMALVDALETQLAASRTTASNLLSALVVELTQAT